MYISHSVFGTFRVCVRLHVTIYLCVPLRIVPSSVCMYVSASMYYVSHSVLYPAPYVSHSMCIPFHMSHSAPSVCIFTLCLSHSVRIQLCMYPIPFVSHSVSHSVYIPFCVFHSVFVPLQLRESSNSLYIPRPLCLYPTLYLYTPPIFLLYLFKPPWPLPFHQLLYIYVISLKCSQQNCPLATRTYFLRSGRPGI